MATREKGEERDPKMTLSVLWKLSTKRRKSLLCGLKATTSLIRFPHRHSTFAPDRSTYSKYPAHRNNDFWPSQRVSQLFVPSLHTLLLLYSSKSRLQFLSASFYVPETHCTHTRRSDAPGTWRRLKQRMRPKKSSTQYIMRTIRHDGFLHSRCDWRCNENSLKPVTVPLNQKRKRERWLDSDIYCD